jgi:hypothetical protein
MLSQLRHLLIRAAESEAGERPTIEGASELSSLMIKRTSGLTKSDSLPMVNLKKK